MNDAAEVESLIPHRLPMRLVERFEPPVEDSIVAFAEVRESWPTVRDGSARTLMLIEVIAQTAAVMQGFRERAQDKPATGGLLVGISAMQTTKPRIPVGTHLVCNVSVSHGVQNYLAFEGRVTDTTGALWLTGAIQAYRPDSVETFGAKT
jgi:predicted hotdog family 3-hydroxylacyl-ACP dehydratase